MTFFPWFKKKTPIQPAKASHRAAKKGTLESSVHGKRGKVSEEGGVLGAKRPESSRI